MAQVGEMLVGVLDPAGTMLRGTAPCAFVARETVMAAAPGSDGRFFKVPKVIER
jgi:aspartyl-tRNA(Asn)/glutamyl-tRNA(Gln) amidotransferase subunit C